MLHPTGRAIFLKKYFHYIISCSLQPLVAPYFLVDQIQPDTDYTFHNLALS